MAEKINVKEIIEKSEEFYKSAIALRNGQADIADAARNRHEFERDALGQHGKGHTARAEDWKKHGEKRTKQADNLRNRKNKMYPKEDTAEVISNILDENYVDANEGIKAILNARAGLMVEAIADDMHGLNEDEDEDAVGEDEDTPDTTETPEGEAD